MLSEVTPFWRVLTSQDKMTKKLPIDLDWGDLQRAMESS